jgi:succinoglycan biosynthesis protein ExoA
VQLSVVIVTHGRHRQLTRCLQHLEAAAKECDVFEYELIIGINGRDPVTSSLLHGWNSLQMKMRLHERQDRLLPSPARNELVSLAGGQWLYFVDDDAYVHPHLFAKFADDLMVHPRASVFGGPNLTPVSSSPFQEASGLALGSRFATFFSAPRYKPLGPVRKSSEANLILCNLFMSRAALGNKPFPPEFLCCEENWVLQNMDRQGHILIYDPELVVWHERRPNPLTLARQIFKYGLGRGQLIRSRPQSAKPSYFVPAAAAFCALFLVAFNAGAITLWTFVLYGFLCAIAAARNGMSKNCNPAAALMSLAVFPIVHVSYGLGLLWGIVRQR